MKQVIGTSDPCNLFNEGHILEGADRCNTILIMIEELLSEHPAIVKAKLQNKVFKASDLIMDCYQEIWRLEE